MNIEHEFGECGAVCIVVQDGRVCVECKKFIPDDDSSSTNEKG